MSEEIIPFTLAIGQDKLDDLRHRLEATRWPEKEPVNDWSQGAPLEKVQALVAYWLTQYDWRRCEAMLNGFGQFKTEIDGLGIHFLHVRSPNPNALPLLLTHGWPGSVIEFHKVIGPLTDPVAYGGAASDAFHLVIPSLPGYGFSDKPSEAGWKVPRIAKAWATLMTRLGYDRYVAQGGDWGAGVTTALGVMRPDALAAIHVNLPIVMPEGPYENLSEAEAAMLAAMTTTTDGTPATPSSRQHGRKQSGTPWLILRRGRRHGFTRNSGHGPIARAIPSTRFLLTK